MMPTEAVLQMKNVSVGSCLPTLVLTCLFYEKTAAYGKQQTR